MLAAPAGESAGQRMERPAQRPGLRVEGPDLARGHVEAAVVGDRRADDDEVAIHHRRRRQRPFALPFRRAPQALVERDLAADAEAVARPAVGAHQAGQPRVRGAGVDAVAGDDHAAVGEVAVVEAAQDGEVDTPRLGAGLGIERDHEAARRRQVEPAVDVDRRRLEGGLLARREHGNGRLARVVGPRLDETADVCRRQARRRRLGPERGGGEQQDG